MLGELTAVVGPCDGHWARKEHLGQIPDDAGDLAVARRCGQGEGKAAMDVCHRNRIVPQAIAVARNRIQRHAKPREFGAESLGLARLCGTGSERFPFGREPGRRMTHLVLGIGDRLPDGSRRWAWQLPLGAERRQQDGNLLLTKIGMLSA